MEKVVTECLLRHDRICADVITDRIFRLICSKKENEERREREREERRGKEERGREGLEGREGGTRIERVNGEKEREKEEEETSSDLSLNDSIVFLGGSQDDIVNGSESFGVEKREKEERERERREREEEGRERREREEEEKERREREEKGREKLKELGVLRDVKKEAEQKPLLPRSKLTSSG